MTKSFDNRRWMDMGRTGNLCPGEKLQFMSLLKDYIMQAAVFEGERAYNGKIFKSKEHTDRLFQLC